MCRTRRTPKKTPAQAGPTQVAPLGGRSDSFMAQSLSSVADSLWEKKASNYLSLLFFACAIICWRKCEV
jgi:hypothetical protein